MSFLWLFPEYYVTHVMHYSLSIPPENIGMKHLWNESPLEFNTKCSIFSL